jgi:hypothetical protein
MPWSRSSSARAVHPRGDDIVLELPITIDEAVLGAKVEVPTVSGRVQLTIPKGTSSGRVFRLKGKGVHSTSGATGDQLVTVRIVLPQTIDEKLAYFMSEWRQSHATTRASRRADLRVPPRRTEAGIWSGPDLVLPLRASLFPPTAKRGTRAPSIFVTGARDAAFLADCHPILVVTERGRGEVHIIT